METSKFEVQIATSRPRVGQLANNNIIKPTICFEEKIHYLCTSETAVSEMAVSLVKR